MKQPIVYLAAHFPKLSETFVYREILGLRAAGLDIRTVSIRPATDQLGDPVLEQLREEAVPLYGAGWGRLLIDACAESFRHPLRTLRLWARSVWLAAREADLRGVTARLKIGVQTCAALALAHRLRPLQPALLHAHMAHVPTTIAMFTARQLGIPFSFTGHAADLFRDRALLRPKLQQAAFVHCISHWHRTFYQELCPRPDADYPLVRCGVDPAEFPPRPAPQSGATRLLAAGRLVGKKGFDVLLTALASPALTAYPWTLTLIGDGPEEDALQAQWQAHPCRDRITLAGAQPNTLVRQAMVAADVFVLPCRVDPDGDRDGIPVVLMEAMIAGAVVISGDIPSIRELIEHNRTGLFVPPGDAEALAGALALVCGNASERERLATAARPAAIAEFSLAVNIQRIMENLQKRFPGI
jgi:colanic acid/amylovoran biosynthesis glycosyltransferase